MKENKEVLKETFLALEQMFNSCDIDYNELKNYSLEVEQFNDYNFVRLVNSFLFNYSKIQDKMGQKLFRKVLFELKEINDLYSTPFRDILSILEKLNIIDEYRWDELREIRNFIAHEYPLNQQERIKNLQNALKGYEELKKIYKKIKSITQD